jgi:purine-nucleoside phosphorylase
VSDGAANAARDFAAAAAIIFGSGLAVVPQGAEIVGRLSYADLGWPVPAVAGHRGELLLARLGPHRLLLACGRVHLYEGYGPDQLSATVDGLAAWGVRRLLVTNAAGGLTSPAATGSVVVAEAVVDLQTAPADAAELLPVCSQERAAAVRAAMAASLPSTVGRYVAVPGPQYETPAEAAWLAGFGSAVGMSTAPEVRAAVGHGMETIVLALTVNRASAVSDHDAVLAAGARLTAGLQAGLPAALVAAWPLAFGTAA